MGSAKGPAFGIPISAGIVLTRKDVVAVDGVCASIMGSRLQSIRHIKKTALPGVGFLEYGIEDEDFESVKKILK